MDNFDIFINNDSKIDIDNLEDVFTIDLEDIDKNSKVQAESKITNLLNLYNDEKFIEAHPEFKKRVDNEIESLRRLLKMAKTNEIIHDNLAKAISHNPGNASLYSAFTRLQTNIISIQNQISSIMNEFTKMCKAYQTEINFETPTEKTGELPEKDVHRGRKSFILEMTSSES